MDAEQEQIKAENERFRKKEALIKRLKTKRDALHKEKADILKTVKHIANMARDANYTGLKFSDTKNGIFNGVT
ncbi:hypothetical protein AGMMS49957_03950 [Synergistales bacterium]|nr:hypothetical protein AGMMS49957_03950 [Synergistales bacterium]